MNVNGVYWASSFGEHYLYMVLSAQNCQWIPTQKVVGQENKYICTIGVSSFYGWLSVDHNLQKQIADARWDQGDTTMSPANGDHTSLHVNPAGSINSFAEKLLKLAQYYDGHKDDCDFIAGKQDSVAWVNTILKLADIPYARRMRGCGNGLPHQNVLDDSWFSAPDSVVPQIPTIIPGVPQDPNMPNPPGRPTLETGQELHIVVKDDWLSKIAGRYLGDVRKYDVIHNWQDKTNGIWNRREIGPNPDLIKPDMRIIIPNPNLV